MKKSILMLLLLVSLWGSLLLAQESSQETIEFSAQKMSGSMKQGQDYTKLSGGAKIKTASMEIQADTIELYGKDFRFIKAEGSVRGVQEEDGLEFSCETMEYDREEKLALFTGAVVLEDKENHVVAKAQRIEYREKDAIAIMQIEVELTKDESISTCAFALYRKEEKLLEMTGNPQVVQGNDTFRAQEIVFNLDTEEITLDGRVKGTVTEEGEDKS
ncbi:MAG: LptA/OstA family protein [Treponema sp.]|nr:organic solvent tolerance protein OstA [Spirochaetaceae bacterium]MEE0132791.1 LptA/OstA family protein [Treponema sp.]